MPCHVRHAGDPTPWQDDDDIFGEKKRDRLTILHHGEDGGGVYTLWAASEAEGRALMRRLTALQVELRQNGEALEARKREAAERARTRKSLFRRPRKTERLTAIPAETAV